MTRRAKVLAGVVASGVMMVGLMGCQQALPPARTVVVEHQGMGMIGIGIGSGRRRISGCRISGCRINGTRINGIKTSGIGIGTIRRRSLGSRSRRGPGWAADV